MMLVYMLYYKDGDSYIQPWDNKEVTFQKTDYMIGGGSSTSSAPRVYKTEAMAERMRRKHFPGTRIKEIEL